MPVNSAAATTTFAVPSTAGSRGERHSPACWRRPAAARRPAASAPSPRPSNRPGSRAEAAQVLRGGGQVLPRQLQARIAPLPRGDFARGRAQAGGRAGGRAVGRGGIGGAARRGARPGRGGRAWRRGGSRAGAPPRRGRAWADVAHGGGGVEQPSPSRGGYRLYYYRRNGACIRDREERTWTLTACRVRAAARRSLPAPRAPPCV